MQYFKNGGKLERRNTKSVVVLITGSLFVLVVVTFTQLYSSSDSDLTPLSGTPVLFHNNDDSKKHHSQQKRPFNLKLSRYNSEAVTTLGRVKGAVDESRGGRIFFSFMHVPYAKPPINELRFKPPQPAEPWTGVRDGTKAGLQCIQKETHVDELRSLGEEDCLYLNVYTPQCKCPTNDNTNPNPNFPVMVYMHGGEYNSGNGTRYGPTYFMDENVVLVTLEFRTGVFGFISTDDEEIQGNLGLKDIIMALRWVQDNIAAFGGDPKKVTVFGNSSGGCIVHALLLSHMSKGLFHRAISQSGHLLRMGGSMPSFVGKPVVTSIAKQFDCPTNSSKAMADCLREIDAKELAIVEGPLVFYAPIVESIPENGTLDQVFLSNSSFNLINDVDSYPMKVPWILGDVSAELLSASLNTLRDVDKVEALNQNWTQEAKTILEFKRVPSAEKLEKIKDFYFLKAHISNFTRNSLIDLRSDNAWVHGSKVAALAHAQHSPVYLYWLTRNVPKSYAEDAMTGFSPPFGVAHADELQYLFLYDGYPEIPIGSVDAKFSQKLIRNWVYFANYGKPEIPEWTPIDPADNGTIWFRLDDDDHLKQTSRLRRRLEFWDDYIEELYR